MADRVEVDSTDSVLAFLIGSLGDTVVALPSFQALRRRFGKARVVLLTNTPVDGGLKAASSVQVLEGTGLVDDYIEYPHGRWSPGNLMAVVRRIRAEAPRIGVYLMQRRTRSQLARDRLFFRACGIRSMIGLGSHTIEHLPPSGDRPLWESEASRMRRSIGAGDRPLTLEDFSLGLSPEEARVADDVLLRAGIGRPFIVASVGAKVSVKDWGEDRWQEFLKRLAESLPAIPLVMIGSADEADRSARMAQVWPSKTANLCGKLTPRQSAAVLRLARLFIGHDSGPMHLSAAVGTPTIAVFSAREMPGVWFPFGQEHNVFYRSVPCRDCRLEQCVEFEKRCIRDIDPAEVARLAIDRIGGGLARAI